MLRCIKLLLLFVLCVNGTFCYGKARQKIVFAAGAWAPYAYMDKNGQAKGLYIDILTELFEKQLGMELVYQNVPWKRAQYNVQNGQADFLVTVPTESRLQYAVQSNLPVLEFYLKVYTYVNHPKLAQINNISSGSDIKEAGLVPVTNIGNGWHKKNIDSFGVATQYVPSEENAFNVLASKRADLTIEAEFSGRYMINSLKLNDQVVATDGTFGPLKFYLLMGKKSQHLPRLSQLNSALNELLNSDRMEEIINNYK